jgi:zinc D-Ala-D-Ala carboxypeptidase
MTVLRYFKPHEFDCSHTGKNEMSDAFLLRLDELRYRCGFPFVITSGYRDPSHPIEAKKAVPGTHSQGIAVDIAVNGGNQRYIIQREAFKMGFTGIGVHKSFIHVDDRKAEPQSWPY